MIKCDRAFFHGSLPFIQKSVLLHSWTFEAPTEKKETEKKRKKSTFVKVYDRGQVDIRAGN